MKGYLSNLLRQLRLLYLADRLRFYFMRWKNTRINNAFRQQYPTVALPPDYLIYESFKMDYHQYYHESKNTAIWLIDQLKKFTTLEQAKLLDWGCGPGRIIRHMPSLLGQDCEYFATDYNADSIVWCQQHLPGIAFNKNSIEANLPYADDFFDVVYGISIFTHLSEPMHYAWYNELHRILKPGGILFLTAQGDLYKTKLTVQERNQYDAGSLVVRGAVKEGHRTFSAFQPPVFMKKLFANASIEQHTEYASSQDVWIVRKTQ